LTRSRTWLLLLTIVGAASPAWAPQSDAALIQASDITNGGAFRISASADGSFSAGGMAIRYVNGERHFLLYQNHAAGTITHVASATSASVFTVQAGAGARLAVGEWVNINRAAAAPGSLPEQGQITNLSGDTLTISPAFGAVPKGGDQVWYWADVVYELVDPTAPSCGGGAYDTDYRKAPRACLYAIWTNLYGDGHHSVRTSWNVSGVPDNPQGILPAGLYWNQAQGALYFAWLQQYASSNVAASLGFATLDSVSGTVGISTAHGPWRPTYTDRDGITQRGAKACEFFSMNPGDGSMLCTSWGVGQIDSSTSWGPDVRWGLAFPRTSTPAGFHAADLSLNHTGANYYCMIQGTCNNTNYVTSNGTLVGSLRSARHPVGWAQIFEDFSKDNTDYQNARIDPGTNGGVSSWDGSDSVTGIVRISAGGKSAVILSGSLSSSVSTDPTNCKNAHDWYENGGIGSITTSAHRGTFRNGEAVTASGGFSAVVTHWNSPAANVLALTGTTGTVSVGATVTGSSSGATGTVSSFTTHGKCTHLCTPAINVAGGVSNSINPYLWFDKPSDIDAVNVGSKTDWTVDPYLIVDLANTFGLHVAPITASGSARQVGGLVFDSTTNDLFVFAPEADDTIGGILFPLIWKLHVGSTTPKPPRQTR